ncbi:MAG: methyltransferase, partial [Rikenella sp.]|nr:methyltransferase [Rikenella sp.]
DGGFVRAGSIILADNVLWYGKVAAETAGDLSVARNDRQTQGILEFNRMVREDARVEKVILPLRDGLTLIRVK